MQDKRNGFTRLCWSLLNRCGDTEKSQEQHLSNQTRFVHVKCWINMLTHFPFVLLDTEVDISIPIPSPRGIIACTLKDAQSMTIRDMEHEIAASGSKWSKFQSVKENTHMYIYIYIIYIIYTHTLYLLKLNILFVFVF